MFCKLRKFTGLIPEFFCDFREDEHYCQTMCNPAISIIAFFVVVFVGLGIWGATKPSDTCDVWCKSLTFAGVALFAWVATYSTMLFTVPIDEVLFSGLFYLRNGRDTVRLFPEVQNGHVLYWMRTPCCFPYRIFKWLKTLVLCCPPEAALTAAATASAPPQVVGEPKNLEP